MCPVSCDWGAGGGGGGRGSVRYDSCDRSVYAIEIDLIIYKMTDNGYNTQVMDNGIIHK